MQNVTYIAIISKVPILGSLINLKINLYGIGGEEIIPFRTSNRDVKDTINLLLISNGEGHLL